MVQDGARATVNAQHNESEESRDDNKGLSVVPHFSEAQP